MRASSLSSPKVVELLNASFVPVFLNNRDFDDKSAAPAEEKAAKTRIYREALKLKPNDTGTVCAYITSADGNVVDVKGVNRGSANVDVLLPMLEQAVAQQKPTKGDALVKAKPQSCPPKCDQETLALNLTARYLEKKGNEAVVPAGMDKVLGTKKAGNWGDLPAENWIVLTKEEWTKLLPVGEAKAGTTWEVDKKVAAKFLNHLYPPTENNDIAKNSIEEQSLRGKVLSVKDGVVRARLDGNLKMKHFFYHKPDDHRVSAPLVGFIDFEPGKRIKDLQLVTDEATYGGSKRQLPFGAALRSTGP